MLLTADQILLHLIGDYIIQLTWMASEKTKHFLPAILHGITYGIPFAIYLYFLNVNVTLPLFVIVSTHIIIDRYRLVKYFIWGLSRLEPKSYRLPFAECNNTGYSNTTPVWLSTWLMIIVDNIIHLCINAAAIKFLA